MQRREGIVVRFGSRNMEVIDRETGARVICSMPGKFRAQGIRPIVGDHVHFSASNETQGRIEAILPRKSELTRPNLSNIERILLVLSLREPSVPNYVTDRFLVLASLAKVEVIVLINKVDLLQGEEDKEKLADFYGVYGQNYDLLEVSAREGLNLERLRGLLEGKVSAMAGMSGVGKSSLLNALNPGLKLRVADLSRQLDRGKHTTTYAELLEFDFGGFIADTPGFANLELGEIKPLRLQNHFPEILASSGMCAFSDCAHVDEPGCYVRELARTGDIPASRYESYLSMYDQLKERERENGGRG